MNIRPPSDRALLWISLAGASAVGPIFLVAGHSLELIFAPAAIFYVLCCAVAVPLVVVGAGRLKFLAWQLGVASLTLAVVGDNIWHRAILRSQIPQVAFMFWALGALASSPVPIYFLLRPLPPRSRYIAGAAIAAVVTALWLGIKRIAG